MIMGQIGGDENNENRGRLGVPERRKRNWQPGQRRHGAKHLEDGIEAAHGPDRLADNGAERDADDAREAVTDSDALQGGQNAPAKSDVLRPVIEKRIGDEILRLAPDFRGRREG